MHPALTIPDFEETCASLAQAARTACGDGNREAIEGAIADRVAELDEVTKPMLTRRFVAFVADNLQERLDDAWEDLKVEGIAPSTSYDGFQSRMANHIFNAHCAFELDLQLERAARGAPAIGR